MLNVVEQKKKFKLDDDFTSYNLDKFSKYFVRVKKSIINLQVTKNQIF